ncbi:MAG: hypothetical protein AAFQ14_20215, partial [Cyanobacteria bacterium J06621_12]
MIDRRSGIMLEILFEVGFVLSFQSQITLRTKQSFASLAKRDGEGADFANNGHMRHRANAQIVVRRLAKQ